MAARIVICAPATLPAFFRDDVEGTCALCHQAVRFRPHVPPRRVLICLECFIVHATPGTTCEVLGEAIEELEALGFDLPDMLTTRIGPAVWHHMRRAWCRHAELVRVHVDGIWYFTCACGYQTPVIRRTAEEAAKARRLVQRDG